MKAALVLAAAAGLWGGPAQAGVLRPDAPCSVAVAALDSNNRQTLGYVVQLIVDVMEAADEGMVSKGQKSVLAALSDDQILDLVADATTECRSNPEKPVRLVATQVYFAARIYAQ